MKYLFVLLSSIACCFSLRAQVLYGTTSGGGTGYSGTITKLDIANSTLTAAYNIPNDGKLPKNQPVLASNGKLYGTATSDGSLFGSGIIYSFDPTTTTYAQVHTFDYVNGDGANPTGSLVQANNGKLYGMTSANVGGNTGENQGVLYSFDPVTNIYTTLKSFTGSNGANPFGSLLQASDGKLYGMTRGGGVAGLGVIFSFDPATNTYLRLYDFGRFAGSGVYPQGSLIQAKDGKLYGMTTYSTNNGPGVIFSFDPVNNTCTQVYTFNVTDGANPQGSLLQASDGKLYGTASSGGSANNGVVFSFNPSTNVYSKLKDFSGSDGANPYGSLIQTSDGKLYGTASNGGSTNNGVVFSFDPSTSTYTKLKDFSGSDGANPQGSFMQANGGKLYSVTYNGGSYGFGVLFSFDPVANAYTSLRGFEGSIYGAMVAGGLVKATDGKLYGMTKAGGSKNDGVIFSFNPLTSTYTKLKEFVGTDGADPENSLMQASNGKLYGMTSQGGKANLGVIFSFDPVTGTYTKIVDFDGIIGSRPYGDLMQASNGKLYGMATGGGTFGTGVLFSIDPTTGDYKIVNDSGLTAAGKLIQASDGKLYGTANDRFIFSLDLATGSYTELRQFDSASGSSPTGRLLQASNGNLYGITVAGGLNNAGVIYSFNPGTGAYAKLVDFDTAGGYHPYSISPDGGLMQACNGKLYGMTRAGGSSNGGFAFSYDPATAKYSKLADFTTETGINPSYAFFTEYQTCGTPVTTGVNRTDSLALVDLYNSTNGTHWTNHTNWLTTQPLSTWYGITVSNNRVTQIHLSNNRLFGSLNSSLGNLDALTYMDFHYNSLGEGPIPSTFGNLHSLQFLDLSFNYIAGSIPSSIGDAVNLTKLILSNNILTDSIPASIGKLKNLQYLDLTSNRYLTGSIPSSIGDAVSLTTLLLGGNKLTGSIPASIGKLQKLRVFSVVANTLSGSIPDSIGYCSSLDTLYLTSNKLTGKIPSTLKYLTKLSWLSLSDNQLTGKITDVYADNAPLTYVDLGVNPFSGQKIPTFFVRFTKLETLSLRRANLTGEIPANVAKFTSLKTLVLDTNQLQGNIPVSMKNMPALHNLSLEYCGLSGELPTLFHNYSDSGFTLNVNSNNLTYTRNPQWNGMVGFGNTVLAGNNHFTFDGLEYLYEKVSYVDANNQAPLSIHIHNNKLAVSAGGTLSRNTYKWYKTGSSTPVATVKGDSTYQPATSGSYYVTITNSVVKLLTLTSDTVTYTAQNVAAINSNLIVSIYPNPVRGIITLNNLNDKTNSKIVISDMSGYVWLTAMSHQQTSIKLDASRLKNGNYLVMVTDGKDIKTVQFVKQ